MEFDSRSCVAFTDERQDFFPYILVLGIGPSCDRENGEKYIDWALCPTPYQVWARERTSSCLLARSPRVPNPCLNLLHPSCAPGHLYYCPTCPTFLYLFWKTKSSAYGTNNHFPILSESGLCTRYQRIWSRVSHHYAYSITKETSLADTYSSPNYHYIYNIELDLC